MKTKLCIFILNIMIVAAVGTPLMAETRVKITEAKGKVEMREPGRDWKPAKVGMVFTIGAFISTGFDSHAALNLGGSILQVKQLTRMKLEELVEKEGTIDTELFLRVGKVRAKIVTEEGLRTNFKLRSPISTAAVRGTEFEYDGEKLMVVEGVVSISNPIGQTRSVITGEVSEVVIPTAPPISPEEQKESVVTVVADTSKMEVLAEEEPPELMPTVVLPVQKAGVSVSME